MLAYGLIENEHAYLKDAWCQLDFVVVTLAWLPIIFPAMGNMSAIRSVRAFRPLRALKRVPGMPVLVNSILAALPPLSTVGLLVSFFFVVLAIVGTELFKGVCTIDAPRQGWWRLRTIPLLPTTLCWGKVRQRSTGGACKCYRRLPTPSLMMQSRVA